MEFVKLQEQKQKQSEAALRGWVSDYRALFETMLEIYTRNLAVDGTSQHATQECVVDASAGCSNLCCWSCARCMLSELVIVHAPGSDAGEVAQPDLPEPVELPLF